MPIPPSPDVAFRLAANAAAAAWAASPPYLSYRVDAAVDVPSMHRHKVISRAVETRTRDDFAVLQDLPHGQRQYAQSFPLLPTFDALSYFTLTYNGNMHDTLSNVKMLQPLTFTDPRATSHADVVVTSLRYYHAEYAPDSSDALVHVTMQPLQTLTRGNNSDFYIHDVYINPQTNLPTRVTYSGADVDFACDYTTVGGHWLVDRAVYARTIYAPLHIGRVRFAVDARFSDFQFPQKPADPRLAQAGS